MSSARRVWVGPRKEAKARARTLALALPCFGAVACQEAPLSARELAGTYQIRFCKSDCGARGSVASVATGILVLADSVISLAGLPPNAVRKYQYFFRWLNVGSQANACFVIDNLPRGVPDDERFAGLTAWSARKMPLGLVLYASPDAVFKLTLSFGHDGSVDGTAEYEQVGSRGRKDHFVVTGSRTRAPDLTRCLAAMK